MSTSVSASNYSRLNPFPATLIENQRLSGDSSAKEVRHIVFDLEGSGLSYRVGQSLGVMATNDEKDVRQLIVAGGFTGEERVVFPKAAVPTTLRLALERELYLASPSRKILEVLAAVAANPEEKSKLEDLLTPEVVPTPGILSPLDKFLSERHFIDLFEEFPSIRGKVAPQTFVECMKKLQPRLYSIASSPKAVGSRVELTVGVVRYTTNGRQRGGVCSTFLADRLKLGDKAGVFVGESPFKLTDDDEAPIIMVGPGTGIAPFRAFLQERLARSAKGDNWLFFGDQHQKSDFLYRREFEVHAKNGFLTRLDLAWSRDQEKKIYVQDLMRQNSILLWRWLGEGAYFYVCGDAKRMAKDVDAALHEIVAREGNMDAPAAAEFVAGLKKTGRYMRDVY